MKYENKINALAQVGGVILTSFSRVKTLRSILMKHFGTKCRFVTYSLADRSPKKVDFLNARLMWLAPPYEMWQKDNYSKEYCQMVKSDPKRLELMDKLAKGLQPGTIYIFCGWRRSTDGYCHRVDIAKAIAWRRPDLEVFVDDLAGDNLFIHEQEETDPPPAPASKPKEFKLHKWLDESGKKAATTTCSQVGHFRDEDGNFVVRKTTDGLVITTIKGSYELKDEFNPNIWKGVCNGVKVYVHLKKMVGTIRFWA